jgi:Spy/CpxP family protein refolding chaperone
MSIGTIRKTAGIAAGVALLAVGGLFAGRAAAGVLPGSDGADAARPRHVFARIARALDLSDDQKNQIRAVVKAHAPEIETQLQAGSAARKALADAVDLRPIDEGAIRARAADLGRVHGDGAVLLAKIRTEIDPILNDAQRAKVAAFHQRLGRRGDRMVRALHGFLAEEGP